jgi:hypothetical protein
MILKREAFLTLTKEQTWLPYEWYTVYINDQVFLGGGEFYVHKSGVRNSVLKML